jgi:hypothetical protein
LNRIESRVSNSSSLRSIEIPRNVEILGSSCFSFRKSLSSISFESNSRLTRIESRAFQSSSLQSIEIPRSVRFIEGSAFSGTCCDDVSREAGRERLAMATDFLVDFVDHRLIRNFSWLSIIAMDADIEILGSSCVAYCQLLSSI